MKTTSPIKNKTDILLICNRLRKWKRFREAELVIIGCNVALRINDLLKVRFVDIHQWSGKPVLDLVEGKTKKPRRITLNATVMESIDRLRQINPDATYLFQSTGNRTRGLPSKPVSRQWLSEILKDVERDLGLDYTLNTHSLRKTFGYHAYKEGADISVLQKLLQHASVKDTWRYIGITEESVQDIYLDYEIEVS